MADATFLLPIFLPPLVLLASFVLSRGYRLRFRVIWTGLAVLLSLPLGTIAILEVIIWTTDHASPGVGVAAVPLFWGWLVALILWFIGSVYALIFRIKRHPQNSN